MDPTNNIATDLFYKIRSRFSGLKLGDANGTVTINPEQARFFDFDYKDGDLSIGHVSISLSEENSIKVYFSTGITESMDNHQKRGWYGFLKELRNFAKRRLMAFDTRDIAKDNLDKRDYQFLSQSSLLNKSSVGESVMNESQLYGTRTMSFQKLMDTRLIIKHSKTLEDNMQPGARSRNISALFVENQDGERFKYPFIHLAGARAMQRHVANGGLPYDEVGKSVISMSEEIAQLKSFSNYVVRNDLMNSDTNDIVEQSQQALDQLREQIARLSKQGYYEKYKESFQQRSPLEVPNSVVEEFKDKFTVKSFREELQSVFPILYRLMQENNSVDYEDIVSMTTENTNDEADVDLNEDEDEFAKFEQWVMNLGEESPITSEDEEIKAQAVKELQELISQEFPVGVDGTNAIQSLKGIIEDPQLYKGIKDTAKEDPEADLRGAIQQYLELYAPDVLEQLDFGDFDPNAQAAGEEPAAAETPAEQPQMASYDPDERNRKDSEDFDPYDVDNISDQDPRIMSGASRQGYMRSDKSFLTRVFGPSSPEGNWILKFTNGVIVMIEPDKSGRRGDEDDYKIFSKDPNAQRYIDAAIDPDEWQGEDSDERNKKDSEDDLPFDVDPADKPPSAKDEFGNTIKHRARHLARKGMRQAMDVKEVAEFISSFYDRDSGTFPKGPEGVVVMVGKKFGEQAEQVARKFVERMAPHQEQGAEQMQELARIRELAGMPGNDMAEASEDRVKFRGTDHDIGEERYVFAIGDNPMVFNFSSDEDNPDPDSPSFEEILAKVQRDGAVEHFRVTPAEQRAMAEKIADERRKYLDQRKNDTQQEEFSYTRTADDVAARIKEKGIRYTRENEKEIIGMIPGIMKDMGIDKKVIIHRMGYDEDFVSDVLDGLEREPDDGPKEPKHPQARDYAEEDSVSESHDDIYTINNPDMERDAETGREEPDQIEVKVEFSSYDDEFEIDKVFRLDTKEDITDKVVNNRKLYFSLAHDVQQREQGRERDYNERIQDDVTPELDRIRKLSGISQGLGY